MKITPPLSIMFRAHYRVSPDFSSSLNDDLGKLFELRRHLRQLSPALDEWFLGGNSKENALLYPAFDEGGPTTEALAVLTARRQNKTASAFSRVIGLWNGEERSEGATMGCVTRQGPEPSIVHFETEIIDFLNYPDVSSTVRKLVEIWHPMFVSVEPTFYEPVFKDRPSVGWMLYLPRILTSQQVPEARALLPVMDRDEKHKQRQLGTIIVTVTDAAFSDQNPEHLAIAHAVEIRLVDQDLLPRFADL
ncbi:Imm52 family immunity protein [Herbaspirillum rubrisubalbicans]|uniref:Imm52 family immunity protein n=1 Tax=Herbaspirillum rubrisubalbicans TaxID=80842 RepID=UPI0015595599|nr:Imm52 family immunity protein [Herbaspirillum rubrisubalbicans]